MGTPVTRAVRRGAAVGRGTSFGEGEGAASERREEPQVRAWASATAASLALFTHNQASWYIRLVRCVHVFYQCAMNEQH